MDREFFLKTSRIGFSKWAQNDLELAELLWGNPAVTRYICADGTFSTNDIINRMNTEIRNESLYQVQYRPIFELATNDLIGCCGLRPHKTNEYETGFHLRPEFWGQGYAQEAAKAVIVHKFRLCVRQRRLRSRGWWFRQGLLRGRKDWGWDADVYPLYS